MCHCLLARTHAYIVKKSAMKKIVQATEEYWKIPYDHLILDRMLASQQLIAYATTPMLSMQCATVPSGIENRLKSFGESHRCRSSIFLCAIPSNSLPGC